MFQRLSGQGNHNGERKAKDRQKTMHSLLLLPGILPKGRDESAPHAAGKASSVSGGGYWMRSQKR